MISVDIRERTTSGIAGLQARISYYHQNTCESFGRALASFTFVLLGFTPFSHTRSVTGNLMIDNMTAGGKGCQRLLLLSFHSIFLWGSYGSHAKTIVFYYRKYYNKRASEDRNEKDYKIYKLIAYHHLPKLSYIYISFPHIYILLFLIYSYLFGRWWGYSSICIPVFPNISHLFN